MADLLELLATGRRNVDALADPGAMQAAASQIGILAASRGINEVVAVSPVAEHVVAAALLMLSRQQAATDPSRPSTVLLVDVNLASGTLMAEASRRVRLAGAEHVEGLVFHALDGAVGRRECGLDRLEVLNP